MGQLNMDRCLGAIEPKRIDREHGANVYVYRCREAMGMTLAYSQEKGDEFHLLQKDGAASEEQWKQLLEMSAWIAVRFGIWRVVDDVI